MKVLLLAAGKAERLRPLTDKKTKALINIGGTSILEHSVRSLVSKGYKDFVVVSGHGHDFLAREVEKLANKYIFLNKVVFNDQHITKNNCYTVLLSLDHLQDDVLLINSDVVYDQKILDEISKPVKTSLVIDNYKELTEESMKIYVDNGRITHINKQLEIPKSFGEYIGISLIEKKHIPELKNALQKIVKEDPSQYYEDGFALMFKKIPFKIISTKGKKWVEVDTHDDLKIARSLLRRNFS